MSTATAIVVAFLTWLAGIITREIGSWFMSGIKIWMAEQQVAKQANDDENQLQNAKTTAEKDAAANQINNDTF